MKVESALDISLSLYIKLKTGFFKTQLYGLSVDEGRIVLTPQTASEHGAIVIHDGDLQSICITKKCVLAGEIEIMTSSNSYIAGFMDDAALEEAADILSESFGRKLVFQEEGF